MSGVAMEPEVMERLNIYIDPEIRRQVQRVGAHRGTKEAATIRWLLAKSLAWWDGLSREQQESV